MTLFWIMVAIVVAGLVVWYLVKEKKKPAQEKEKPETPAPPPPPEGPGF